jgi:hypothetical protein
MLHGDGHTSCMLNDVDDAFFGYVELKMDVDLNTQYAESG